MHINQILSHLKDVNWIKKYYVALSNQFVPNV